MLVSASLAEIANHSEGGVYIEESVDFLQFRKHIAPLLKHQKSHVEMACALLKQTLHQMYGSTDIQRLVLRSTRLDCVERFSLLASNSMSAIRWSASSKYSAWSALKALLAETNIDRSFVAKMSHAYDTVATAAAAPEDALMSKILRTRYARMTAEERRMAQRWTHLIRVYSGNKSILSLRSVLTFWITKCLPQLGTGFAALSRDGHDFAEGLRKTIHAKLADNPHFAKEVCGDTTDFSKRFGWLQLFVTHVLECDLKLDDTWVRERRALIKQRSMADAIENYSDGSDAHRLSVTEMERLYASTENRPRDRLMYLLLITTGMRIGGLAKIVLRDVVTLAESTVRIPRCGRTLEKGGKWFTFMLAPIVHDALESWVKGHRPSSPSKYLFPGRRGVDDYITTHTLRNSFHGMCRRAKIAGPHLHPHSLRHSYAHILLELGNDVDKVAKMLGHANSNTTEKFYLKESAAEAASRADIPWLNNDAQKRGPVVPAFLAEAGNADAEAKRKKIKKKRNKLAALSRRIVLPARPVNEAV